MKLRSTIFLTLSLIVHAAALTALALSHFRGKEAASGDSVEVTMGEDAKPEAAPQLVAANDATPVTEQPEIKPIEQKIEPVQALPKKETPKPKKIAKIKKAAPVVIPTELPAKEKTEEPENLSPKLEDSDAVVAAEPELVPVKEQVAAQPADEAEDKVETAAPAPAPAAPTPAPVTPNLGQGGESQSEAVSYLNLTQYSGNKAPEYPVAARMEQRQGQVDLLYRVAKDGRVTEVTVAKSSGHKDLDEAAVKAIAKYRFQPGQEGWAKHPVIFKLSGAAAAMPSKLRTNHAATE